jgi:PAS domain S-box-containing protein
MHKIYTRSLQDHCKASAGANDLKPASPVVHIVVLGPKPVARAIGADDTIEALGRLGAEVSIEVWASLESPPDTREAEDTDLFVLDCRDRREAARWLESFGHLGPPVLRVLRDGPDADDESALDSFRGGAAQCIRVGEDFANVLAAAALELIHQWQRERERGVVERRIRWLEDLHDAIVNQIPAALIVVDGDGRVVTLNPACARLFEVSESDATGRDFAKVCPQALYREAELAEMLDATRKQKEVPTRLAHWGRGGTMNRVVDVRCQCLDEQGQLLLVLTDISEIKQLERQVLQSEKMASIGQLAAGVAHEINNPVGFIHANLFQLAEYLQDLEGVWDKLTVLQDTIESGRDIGVIREASAALRGVSREIDLDFLKKDLVKAVSESSEGSERIRHIVRDLRDFSRQDTGELALADVNRCVDTTANIVWTMMKHVVVLKKDYAVLPRLHCYPKQLEQVLMNLLVNACQSIEAKGSDPNAVGEVEVQTLCRDGGVAIIIRDTGAGIPPENLDRIFEPFFTTKDVGDGTGLGLSTSYSIIARHGGEIRVQSEVGKGTTFDVWLPERVAPEEPDAD